jgi:signal transduction histidine kinase
MSAKKRVSFEASANLQRLLGRELIPNDEMAIVELVKNSYDSQARHVRVLIRPEAERRPGLIRITDDGSGMSEEDVGRLFMVAGYSERPEEIARGKRVPTGEKGIGRFAADKLGERLDVFTKTKKSPETLHLAIDWRDFDDRRKKFNEVDAVYDITESARFALRANGTVLEISGLRAKWDTQRLSSLGVGLSDLLNPFDPPKNFSITLEAGNQHGTVVEHKLEPLVPDADLVMTVSVVGDRIHRVVRRKGQKAPVTDERTGSVEDLARLRGLRAQFLHFDKRPNKKAAKGLEPGVRVYRDGFRIEPFGSRTADWLHIAEKRAKRAGHAHVVPSRLFGFVEISRTANPDLSDTTSRQALLDSVTARSLVTVLRAQLDALEELLRSRAEPRWKENRRRQAIEVEQARLHTLGVMSFGLAHELRQPLQAIRSEAANINTRLGQLGVNDTDISEAQASIDRGVSRIDKNISLVSDIAKGSVTEKSACDLADLVRKEVDLIRPRASAVGVTIEVQAPSRQAGTVNQFAVLTVLINYLQNSLEALEASKRKGKVTVTLKRKTKGHYLEVSDNGDGIAANLKPQIFKKFATQKTGGMGVGLYYCKTIVESHGGEVGFESPPGSGARFWMLLPEG